MKTEQEQIWLECVGCQKRYPIHEVHYRCHCGGLIAVERDKGILKNIDLKLFDQRLSHKSEVDRSGVWRFREGICDIEPSQIVTHLEGSTNLYRSQKLSNWLGLENFYLKHEGENPTGSFKDRGMTVAVSQAKRLGKTVMACASTGNTSASLAAYAAFGGIKALVFLPAGQVALGKLSQAIGYGAKCLAIKGDFDAAMALVYDLAHKLDIYMVNSLNPFRLEGQKTIIWELLQDLNWQPPDWIIVPGGNLGNTSAFGKALKEAYDAGWIAKLPRLATIQAEGANPFYLSFKEGFKKPYKVQAKTIATAIQIGDPVNYQKAKAVITQLNGVVLQVSEEQIIAAKRLIDGAGIGCEPASACSLAGTKLLREGGVIASGQTVVGILTGHMLKDPNVILDEDNKHLIEIEPTIEAVKAQLV